MRVPTMIVGMLLAVPLAFAEELPLPQVPDPFGLGERLALIDYLRDTCKLTPPPDATMELLVALYWKHHRKGHGEITEDAADQALAVDRMRRMRTELKERYQIDAQVDADEATLGRLLNEARTKASGDAVKQVLDKAAARENPANAQEAERYADRDRASAQVRMESIEQDERAARAEIQKLDEQRRALARQEQEQQDVLANLRRRYNEQVAKHNQLVSLYNKQTKDGSSDALRTYEQLQEQRTVLNQAEVAIGQQEATIGDLVKNDEALVARRKRFEEALETIAQRRFDEQASGPVAGPASRGSFTPGGVAEAPAAGSQQAKLVAAVMLLVVKDRGTGTGFVVSNDGLVVTNAHVLGDRNATVMAMWDAGANRRPVRMTVVDFAEADDLALLKAADGAPFEPLPMNEVYELQRPLIAAGFPLAGSVAGTLQTSPSDIVVSRGILGAVRRGNGRVEWLQHDCRVASGNSGGPVIDHTTGAVIGVTTMVLRTDGVKSHGDGINLAIPIRKVMDRFDKHLRP